MTTDSLMKVKVLQNAPLGFLVFVLSCLLRQVLLYVLLSLNIVLFLNKQSYPDELLHFVAFHLGLSLPKYVFSGCWFSHAMAQFIKKSYS